MTRRIKDWVTCVAAALALVACTAAEQPSTRQNQSYSGWYTAHGPGQSFQPCGQAPALRVPESGELRARAKKFGLDEDTPVYVRLTGTVSADGKHFSVTRVDQFGSPTPVRDCAMTGLQTQSAAPGGIR